MLTKLELQDRVWYQVWGTVYAQVRSKGDPQVGCTARAQILRKVMAQVEVQVSFQVRHTIWQESS